MATLRRWNVLERLDCEERITGFLEAVLVEGGMDAMPRALAKAAQSRTINQLAKETGLDRKTLCEMFLEGADIELPEVSQEVICKFAKAFPSPCQSEQFRRGWLL